MPPSSSGTRCANEAVEELAVLSDPRPGVYCPRNIVLVAKPTRRIPGQARRADHRDAGSHMLMQVAAQQRLLQRLARRRRTGVSVRIDQTRKHPAVSYQFGTRDGIGGPAIAIRVQIHRITAGQCYTANP